MIRRVRNKNVHSRTKLEGKECQYISVGGHVVQQLSLSANRANLASRTRKKRGMLFIRLTAGFENRDFAPPGATVVVNVLYRVPAAAQNTTGVDEQRNLRRVCNGQRSIRSNRYSKTHGKTTYELSTETSKFRGLE
jgi:hypothetical protein